MRRHVRTRWTASVFLMGCGGNAPDEKPFDGFTWGHEWASTVDTAARGTGADAESSAEACWDVDLASAMGSAVGSGDQTDGSNVFDCNGGTGRELVFRWRPPADGRYVISTHGSPSDTVLEVRAGCDGASLGCNDDSGAGLSSQLTLTLDAGSEVVVIADSYSTTDEDLVVVNIE